MKKSVVFAILTVSFLLMTGFSSDSSRELIGTWVNPPTFERSGKMLGFKFMKDGKCEAVGIPSLELATWKIDGGNLILEGLEINDDGTKSKYTSIKPIVKLNRDTLQVLNKVKGHACFTYLNTKHVKKLVKSGKLIKGE